MKSHGAVNVISGVAVAGVAVATAAIVIVLSVFNGFSRLTSDRFSIIDPPLLVVPEHGKVLARADSLARAFGEIEGVEHAIPVLEERGLVIAGDNSQVGVVFKGVGDSYDKVVDLSRISNYEGLVAADDTLPRATVSVGVAANTNMQGGLPIELYTLRRVGRINPANPAGAFFSQQLSVDRVVSIDQQEFDADHMLIPLDVARRLLQYNDGEASAIELWTAPTANLNKIAARVEAAGNMKVLDRARQHGEAYRMIAVEKWVTFAMLIFILIIAAFNITSTLSLMVVEKRENMATLSFLGATHTTIRGVFSAMAVLISFIGGLIGIIVGVGLSLAQQWGGLIKLGGDPSKLSIDVYPVEVQLPDIFAVLGIILVVSFIIALITRLFSRS